VPALVQAAPPAAVPLEPLGTLASQGVLGAIVVVLLVAYTRKDKQLTASQEERTREAVDAVRMITEGVEAMKDATDATRDNSKGVQDLAMEVRENTRAVERLSDNQRGIR